MDGPVAEVISRVIFQNLLFFSLRAEYFKNSVVQIGGVIATLCSDILPIGIANYLLEQL